VGIHPPKEQEDHTPFQQGRKRARRYAASKQSQALRREKQAEYYRYLTRSYNKESAHLFYSPAHLYNPNDPARILHIRTRDKTGRELSELEQSSVALFVWSYQAARVLEKRKIAGSDGLRKRLQTLADKAVATQKFISSMDIRTQAELITHIKECGSDIAELKRDIARQNAVLTRLTDVMDAIDRWENQRDPDARIWLEEHHCAAEQEIAAAQKKYARAMGRKVSGEDLLEERKREYRHLKEAESLLHPASNAAEWQEYLESVFSKEIAKKIGWADADTLTRQLHQMGKTIGLLPEDVERLVDAAKKRPRQQPGQSIAHFCAWRLPLIRTAPFPQSMTKSGINIIRSVSCTGWWTICRSSAPSLFC